MKEYNDAWSTVRKRAIQKTQVLRNELSNSVFTTGVIVSQQKTADAIRGSYSSTASAMARLNILV
ncbi:hypothetical protein [Polymorphum gilvum]|uniref:hypothetical protein n=1 Tax=Polymorphum gilvum TaxID=991904 RepID=UPI00031FE729|nr:hypothetical protein [Polymorphum gilvum]